jgi:hypothetical protein
LTADYRTTFSTSTVDNTITEQAFLPLWAGMGSTQRRNTIKKYPSHYKTKLFPSIQEVEARDGEAQANLGYTANSYPKKKNQAFVTFRFHWQEEEGSKDTLPPIKKPKLRVQKSKETTRMSIIDYALSQRKLKQAHGSSKTPILNTQHLN